jgi:hypothetical protein
VELWRRAQQLSGGCDARENLDISCPKAERGSLQK